MSIKNLKMWRESASLIISAKSVFAPINKYNYKVLTLKRSTSQTFMPGAYVFPGGNISKCDYSDNWWNLFTCFGYSESSFNDLHINEKKILNNELPKFLSLRICAIRETFEECGILICRSPNVKQKQGSWASTVGGVNLIEWQHKVHKNPEEFLKLCQEFQICPDVWALMTWSNWATPPSYKYRFNTMFFLTTLNQRPVVHPDDKEIKEILWEYPDKYIELGLDLPVPQFYEFSRLKKVRDIEKLAKFAKERAKDGCETYLPHRVKTKQCLYSILPGDDYYPISIDKNKSEVDYVDELPEMEHMNRVAHNNNGWKIITKQLNTKHLIP